MQTDFMRKLAEMMPKQPEPQWTDRPMIAFKQESIRRNAEAFAAALQDLPRDRTEFQSALWVFGEMLCGDMEKRMNAALKLAEDAMNLAPPPKIILKEKP